MGPFGVYSASLYLAVLTITSVGYGASANVERGMLVGVGDWLGGERVWEWGAIGPRTE